MNKAGFLPRSILQRFAPEVAVATAEESKDESDEPVRYFLHRSVPERQQASIPARLVRACRLALLENDELDVASQLAAAWGSGEEEGEGCGSIGYRNELVVVTALRQSFELQKLRRGGAADEARVIQMLRSDDLSYELKCALLYRLGEHRVLNDALKEAQERLSAALVEAYKAIPMPRPLPADAAPKQGSDAWEQLVEAGSMAVIFATHESATAAIATKAIAAGGVVMSFPLDQCLTVLSAASSEGFGQVGALDAVGGASQDLQLTLYVLHLQAKIRDLGEGIAAPQDWQSKLVSMLPAKPAPLPTELLQDSAATHDQLFPALCEALPEVYPPEAFAQEHYLRAAAIVEDCAVALSLKPVRGHQHILEATEGDPALLAVLPFREWFRHHPHSPVEIALDDEGLNVVMRTMVAVEQGDEVVLKA